MRGRRLSWWGWIMVWFLSAPVFLVVFGMILGTLMKRARQASVSSEQNYRWENEVADDVELDAHQRVELARHDLTEQDTMILEALDDWDPDATVEIARRPQ